MTKLLGRFIASMRLFLILAVFLSFSSLHEVKAEGGVYDLAIALQGGSCQWVNDGPNISATLTVTPTAGEISVSYIDVDVIVSSANMTYTETLHIPGQICTGPDPCVYDLGSVIVPRSAQEDVTDGSFISINAQGSAFEQPGAIDASFSAITGCTFVVACGERPNTVNACGIEGGCSFAGEDYRCEGGALGYLCKQDDTCAGGVDCTGKLSPGSFCDPATDECCDVGGDDYECESHGGIFTCGFAGTGDDITGPPPYDGPLVDFDSFLKYAYQLLQPVVVLFVGLPRIIYSGYLLKTSDGDPGKVKQARESFWGAVSATILAGLGVTVLRVGVQLSLGTTI